MILENANIIRKRISATCERCGRNPENITLVAVTKTFGFDVISSAIEAGLKDFGENYVGEFHEKSDRFIGEDLRWHFIGHLQRNKVKNIIGKTFLIHSVDSIELAREISKHAVNLEKNVDILLEVNTSGEKSKFGVEPDEAGKMVEAIQKIQKVNLMGLMTIGPFLPDPESSRPAFRMLRQLRDTAQANGISLPHLSMGMTNDFEIAIEEGATIIRIGTALFGKRAPKQKQELSQL
ncbi:MAG: YggS family pyridoxal phosphate-dependent enzyme [Bacteroidota bacterium]